MTGAFEALNWWVAVVWLATLALGAIGFAVDAIRLWLETPKTEEVEAEADWQVENFGTAWAAYDAVANAMIKARTAGDSRRYRFLKEVFGELLKRTMRESSKKYL